MTWGAAGLGWSTDPGGPQVDPDTVETEVRRHPRGARWLRAHVNPDVATGSVLTAIGVITVVGAALIGLLLVMVQAHEGFARFDAGAARFGATHATQTSTRVLRFITQFGGALVLVPIAIVVAAVEGRRYRSWAPVTFLAVVVGCQYVLANLIKAVVNRTRPDVLRLTGFSGPSFPSGHATAAAAGFAAFALLIGRGRDRRTKRLLAAISVGAAVLIAATRVNLGVHWLTDVLAGLCLGWTWFAVCSMAFGGRRLRFGAPLETAEAVVDSMAQPTHGDLELSASTEVGRRIR